MSHTCISCREQKGRVISPVIDAVRLESFSIENCCGCGLGITRPQPIDLAPYYPSAYYGGRHGATAGFCVRRRLRLMGKGEMRECGDEKCANAGMRECANARMRECGSAGMRECGNGKCANAEMRECANAGMRECANGEEHRTSNIERSTSNAQRSTFNEEGAGGWESGKEVMWQGGKRGGNLLDIGCGDGSFLLAAQAQGWVVTGVERFPEDARKNRLEVVTDVGELASRRDGGSPSGGRSDRPPLTPAFDCITLWHSLEHIADPFALLGQVSALLAPGGQVIVAVPDFGGWQARLFGRFWLHLDVPRHLWHFTLPALREAFNKAGLDVMQTHHQEFEYDLLGWSQSALNALFKQPNVFFNWLTGKPTCVGKPMRVLQVALGFFLTGLFVPLVWLGCLFKRGGTLVVIGGRRG